MSTTGATSDLVHTGTEGRATRRAFGRGSAGLAMTAGLTWLDLDTADGKKRKKKNKKRRKKKNRNGGDGGDDGGGGGGHVDSCGNRCGAAQVCVDGFCVTAFGAAGAGEGQFNRPTGVSLAVSSEQILVVDSGNRRVVQLSLGVPNGGLGSPANGEGQFTEAAGIASEILVVDAAAHRVQEFGVNGQFQRTFGCFGSGAEQINAPRGIAVHQQSGRRSGAPAAQSERSTRRLASWPSISTISPSSTREQPRAALPDRWGQRVETPGAIFSTSSRLLSRNSCPFTCVETREPQVRFARMPEWNGRGGDRDGPVVVMRKYGKRRWLP